MKSFYRIIIPLIFIFFFNNIYSQTIHSKESSLSPPIKIPMLLSGSFGELRPGHFHSGIDIKTQGVNGHKLYALANGYVSRIKISASGYGKALYIHHPELGLTSVYAHVSAFNKELEEYILKEQYKNKSYEIQLFPKKDEFNVKKGEIIAFSGNSGSSQGPHLHFEIRELSNQHPLNPMDYNFDITDNIPPKIFQIAFYPENSNSGINQTNDKLIIDTKQRTRGEYTLNTTDSILLHGNIGFGIKTYDFHNNSSNWLGVSEIELFIDGIKIYHHRIDEFSFRNTRYINSLIDYEEKIKNNASIQKLFLEPHNNLSIYEYVKNNGIYTFSGDSIHSVKFRIKDSYGNTSTASFKVYSNPSPPKKDSSVKKFAKTLPYNQKNEFYTDHIKLDFPAKAFYDTVLFNYNRIATENDAFFSDIHDIHNKYTPVHKYFSLSIKAKNISPSLVDKIFIVQIEDDEEYNYVGGKKVNSYLTARVREFGKYAIMCDTINPTIQPVSNIKTVNKNDKIIFKIRDDLSGIDTYNGFIDGEWVLFEYDKKNNLIYHHLDKSPVNTEGLHEIELYVGDKMNNIATYYTEFTIQK